MILRIYTNGKGSILLYHLFALGNWSKLNQNQGNKMLATDVAQIVRSFISKYSHASL